MSHDIRTPLNGIIGLLKIDETHFEDKELIQENHKKMKISWLIRLRKFVFALLSARISLKAA